MEAWLSVHSEDPVQTLQELDHWLGGEPALRGMVSPRDRRPGPGELGVVPEVLIAVLGSGGAASVLAGSLKSFLARPRGADVRIVVSTPEGPTVELEARRVDDVEALVRSVLDASARPPESGPTP